MRRFYKNHVISKSYFSPKNSLGTFKFNYKRDFSIYYFVLIPGQDILDTPIGELPTAIAEDIIKILTNSLTLIGQCGPPEIGSFNLLLHTRSNPNNPIVLNLTNPVEIQNGKKTILLIHGYLSSSNLTSLQTMKTKYLIRYDCNVLLLDWSEITYAIYTSPYCQIPLVADFLADFFCLLDGNYSISVGGLHLVGHSLGAQMSGYIGQLTKTKCSKTVGRITGLDPAGPLYSGAPISQRLDAGDAVFVDVVHTNEGIFGYTGNCGDIDFDANCGTQQPGCPVINLSQIADTLGSVGEQLFTFNCDK